MKLNNRKIAFGLTSPLYTFKNTIEEIKKIAKLGGSIIPIMPFDTYKKASDFINEIETITNNKVIYEEEKAKRVEADIMIIAPCSR